MRPHCTVMNGLTTGPHGSVDLNLHRCKSQGIFSVKITSVFPDSKGELTDSNGFMPGALLQMPEASTRTDPAKQNPPREEIRATLPGPTGAAVKASDCVEEVIEHRCTQCAPALLHAGNGRPLVLHAVIDIHRPHPQGTVKAAHSIYVASHEHHT